MNITVLRDTNHPSYQTGGECASCDLTIFIDPTLPLYYQKERIIHAVVENYFQGYPHDTYDEIAELICDALEKLNGSSENNR